MALYYTVEHSTFKNTRNTQTRGEGIPDYANGSKADAIQDANPMLQEYATMQRGCQVD